MAEQDNQQTEVATDSAQTTAISKFCVACGDIMHKELIKGRWWWVCNDTECGYRELVR